LPIWIGNTQVFICPAALRGYESIFFVLGFSPGTAMAKASKRYILFQLRAKGAGQYFQTPNVDENTNIGRRIICECWQ